MHFVLSYDLSAEGSRRAEIENRIERVLSPYPHVKRLTTFYIIRVANAVEWESIRTGLNNLANDIQEEFHYIMTSPNREAGKYNGILYKGEWDAINEITTAP